MDLVRRPRKTIRLTGTVKVVATSLDHESALAVAYVQAALKDAGSPAVPASTVLRMAVRLLAAGMHSCCPSDLVAEAQRVSAVRKADDQREAEAWERLGATPLMTWPEVCCGPNAGADAEALTLRAAALVEQLMQQPGWNLRLRRRVRNERKQ